ncbi:PD40 domain-containing protein [Aneurinibacillus soli]|uniref:PD40 domain-containing protein n=1 Tax=Aneurinibacillus soli TaxID=1500254 RepID=UPI0012FD4CC7|nr:PD40 domain-containing protein [Aneurinibacillus soli]
MRHFRIFLLFILSVLYVLPSSSASAASASKPIRVYKEAFPAKIVFLHDHHLWFINGNQAGAAPAQLTKNGFAQIVGWSPSGKWLAYLFSEKEDYENVKELWVVNPKTNKSYLIEKRVNVIDAHRSELPAWSTTSDTLAYMTSYRGQKNMEKASEDRISLKIATMEQERSVISPVLIEKENMEDFAWTPDGKSLTVSYARTENNPMKVENVALDGESTLLFSIPKEEVPGIEGMEQRSVVGMKWSPDGRYLAYFLHPNSGSTSADLNTIEVINMQTKKRIRLGSGLKYAEWFAWSPDSMKLAYIDGEGREATENKRLYLFDVKAEETIVHADQKGQADTHPVWTTEASSKLLFTRGPASDLFGKKDWSPLQNRRIWIRTQDGQEKAFTSASTRTSDYNAVSQVNGKGVIFLRVTLDKQPFGSVYYQSFTASKPVEWVRGVDCEIGYYGSFLPASFAVYQGK